MTDARRDHAIVLGASIAGLAAARALSSYYRHVTVLERDALPDEPAVRKGIPQAAHAHGLLASGYRVLDAYFPGMMDDLVQDGAVRADVTGDFLWFHFGRWKLRADCGLRGIVVTRPLLEAAMRRRVRALPNIAVRTGCAVDAPSFDEKAGRVTGVRFQEEGGATVELGAELIVDALGRGSPSPRWLSAWGLGAVPEETIEINVGYATASIERRPNDLFGTTGAVLASAPPRSKRTGFVVHAEGGRWMVTLMGVLGDHPPAEPDGWKAFAQSLPDPLIFELVKDRAPLGPIATYRFAANRRRWYSRLPRFPEGFLALGDSACSFNPIYGQGMSLALCQAKVLDDCVAEGDGALAQRFFARSGTLTDWAWAIAAGEDLRFPSVEGKRPPGTAMINRYMERAHRAATRDPVVLRRFFDVANLLAPPTSMLAPSVLWRVLAGGLGGAQESPAAKLDRPTSGPSTVHSGAPGGR